MRIGVPNQTSEHERRVALVPETIPRIAKTLGDSIEIVIESSAGAHAFFADMAYEQAGVKVADGDEAWSADLVACVRPPGAHDIGRMREGAALLGMLRPGADEALAQALVDRRITALAFEAVPRITRAQKCDALSAMSTVAGYRAVIRAAEASPRFFPMLMTAAGTVTPAKALILGAGVAGLQAIATARRLGAAVSAFDIRAAAAEQVRSLGAKFLDIGQADAEAAGGYARAQTEEEQAAQRERLAENIAAADILITTALIPGRPAPRLVERSAVERMKAGSVIVDLAAETGGNCEPTKPEEVVDVNGVTILGPTNLPGEMPLHASTLYARTVLSLLEEIVKESALTFDLEDALVGPTVVTHAGEARHRLVRASLGLPETEEASA